MRGCVARGIVLLALAAAVAVCALPARSAEAGMDAETAERLRLLDGAVDALRLPGEDRTPAQRAGRGETLNQAFVALTGEAVNPLFGVTALGMYRFFTTPEHLRDGLPLYDRPVVWVPLLCILLLMLFNATICEAMPFLKVPLNALGDMVNKAGAVAVLPLVVKLFADQFAAVAAPEFAFAADALFPSAFAGEAGAGIGSAVPAYLGWIAGAVAGSVLYGAVWLTFNVIDVLVLVCPFPGLDAALKSFRLAVVGALAGAHHVSPALAFVLALIIAGASLLLAGWSFRLSVFGLVFSTDILFFRKRGAEEGGWRAFSCAGLKAARGVPLRTLGALERNDGGRLVFSYRPWLVLGRREVDLGEAAGFAAGRGLLNPFLVAGEKAEVPWLRLPPRYRGEESVMATTFGLTGITDCGLGGALRSWLGGKPQAV